MINEEYEIFKQDIGGWINSLSDRFNEEQLGFIHSVIPYFDDEGVSRACLQRSLALMQIVDAMRLDHESLVAAFFLGLVRSADCTVDEIKAVSGDTVAHLIEGMMRMERIGEYQGYQRGSNKLHAENLRKMLLAMVEDVRVVLIKLADQLLTMRTLNQSDAEDQQLIARETQEIYAPLANRLGIWQVKWELEDLSLRYLQPDDYHDIAKLLDERRADREDNIQQVMQQLREQLDVMDIHYEVSGRPKHIYSIWKKMQRKNLDFYNIFDVRAVRVLVAEVADCYAVLGVVHGLWRHIPREFDDYIAHPKENLYRSLHTAVIGPGGKTLEIQIRTFEMHDHAELGVASHWRYKEGAHFDAGFEEKIAWLRQLLEVKEGDVDEGDIVDQFKAEASVDRIYVLTPQGQIIDLQHQATPLDFAYHIHTDIGHCCRGARVNGRIVPLTYQLQTGDQVEILTARNGTPSRDWLNPHLGYLNTARARSKVKYWFRGQEYETNVQTGRGVLDKEFQRLAITDIKIESLAKQMKFPGADELLAAIGRGDVTHMQISNGIQRITGALDLPDKLNIRSHKKTRKATDRGLQVSGVGGLLTTLASCCNPVPYDPVAGYITKGRGVSIHRQDCVNLLQLGEQDQSRIIEVAWGDDGGETYPVDIELQAYDRHGLLRDITTVLANEKINVLGANTSTNTNDQVVDMILTLEVSDINQLSMVLTKIAQLPNVLSVARKNSAG
ncbi:MAG: GTP diphosphokinase [Gammaproteobacteria bacterium]|nr:GTP diphosphokinase [Gammaproteobacteria bacterium]